MPNDNLARPLPGKPELLFEGSSKRFFARDEKTMLMCFKDDIHGRGQASVISGSGEMRGRFTHAFFLVLEEMGIATHLAYNTASPTGTENWEGLVVQRLSPTKIEVIVRNVARGHWVDSHKLPLFEGGVVFAQPVVEFCLKIKEELPDGRVIEDPRIGEDIIVALHNQAARADLRGALLRDREEIMRVRELALRINAALQEVMAAEKWLLEDFKFEVGWNSKMSGTPREFIIIDEISPDCSRVRDRDGNSITKDLFRERRPAQEVLENYQRLVEVVEHRAARNRKSKGQIAP